MNLGENKSARQEPSRLHNLAPASLTISPDVNWNVAIPLLSPLITSPDKINLVNSNNNNNNFKDGQRSNNTGEVEKKQKSTAVLKKWQHPASPFSYNPTPFVAFV